SPLFLISISRTKTLSASTSANSFLSSVKDAFTNLKFTSLIVTSSPTSYLFSDVFLFLACSSLVPFISSSTLFTNTALHAPKIIARTKKTPKHPPHPHIHFFLLLLLGKSCGLLNSWLFICMLLYYIKIYFSNLQNHL